MSEPTTGIKFFGVNRVLRTNTLILHHQPGNLLVDMIDFSSAKVCHVVACGGIEGAQLGGRVLHLHVAPRAPPHTLNTHQCHPFQRQQPLVVVAAINANLKNALHRAVDFDPLGRASRLCEVREEALVDVVRLPHVHLAPIQQEHVAVVLRCVRIDASLDEVAAYLHVDFALLDEELVHVCLSAWRCRFLQYVAEPNNILQRSGLSCC